MFVIDAAKLDLTSVSFKVKCIVSSTLEKIHFVAYWLHGLSDSE